MQIVDVRDHIELLSLPAEIRRAKRIIGTVGQVVEAPINAIEKEMHINAMRGGMAESVLGVAHPLVAHIAGFITNPARPRLAVQRSAVLNGPGISGTTTQKNLIKLMN